LYAAVLMPEQILGKDIAARLKNKKADAWYPVAEIIDPLEELGRKLGADSLRKVGSTIFNAGPAEIVQKSVSSARDLAYGFDRLYRSTNRGLEIGSWTVVEFKEGRAVLEKTTPHHCSMEEGIIDAAFRAVNTPSTVYQSACVRTGADACRFVITSHVVDVRWTGRK
jgi:hypothetical protein